MSRSPYSVLVIDDEQVVLDASKRLLSAEGFEVATALDGESGLRLHDATNPDLAIVDLKLPGMSGLAFMDAAIARNPEIVVILTTGVAGADQAVAALNHGAFDFLPKPFTYEELMSPIVRAGRYMEQHRKPTAVDAELLLLGVQAWARLEEDDGIRVGVTDLFQVTAGPILEVTQPTIDLEIRQGGPLGRLRAADAHWHVALSAVGGRVIALNDALRNTPHLVNDDPFGEGWLAVVRPTELHRDLLNLRGTDR